MDSSAYQEYLLMRFLISERNAGQIFLELPVNYQLYLNKFLASGDLGVLKRNFPDSCGHAQLKLHYIKKLKEEFPGLELYCSESGKINASLYFLNTLFFEVSNQIFGHDTARIDINMDVELNFFLKSQYEQQLDSIFMVYKDEVLDRLIFELINMRFTPNIPRKKQILKLSRDWLDYLESDSSSMKYFKNPDHLKELVLWFIKGVSLNERRYKKNRDAHIAEFIELKAANVEKSAILLFGNAHLSPSWLLSKNLNAILKERGKSPVIIELYYERYPYYFVESSQVKQVVSAANGRSFLKLYERNWILYLKN